MGGRVLGAGMAGNDGWSVGLPLLEPGYSCLTEGLGYLTSSDDDAADSPLRTSGSY